jgi:acetylornithine deacetylase/succinyl-diaminopimelate desuccinylase-like protein
VKKAAEWLAGQIRDAGLEDAEVVATDGHPIVVASHITDPSAPTILVYGHYDVQPEDPVELWTSPPFEPDIRDGRMYARGAIDDKGQVYMHVKALEARLKNGVGLPVNVKLVFEGEEEVGSKNLETFLKSHAERLDADAVLISDTGMFSREIPSITIGLRGLAYVEVVCRGPKGDLHSGSYGGAVVNPANALCGIVAALKDDQGRVTIPGFYDRVQDVSDVEKEGLAKLPFDEKRFVSETGVTALDGEAGYTTLERLWYRPTLDVNGLLSGFTGEGAKTVLPSHAMAKISMRLVPDQDPSEIAELARAHIERLAPTGVTVAVTEHHGGTPWVSDPTAPIFGAGAAALERAFGNEPVFIREGGSIPIVPMFESLFGPVLLLGFGLPGSNLHAPDEWIDLDMYNRGIATLVDLYDEIAKRGV